MAEIVKSRFQGILVPDERFGLDNITDEDHATAPSSITAAGPHPGIPAAEQPTRMVLQSSGEQSAGQALQITTTRAGHPGLERGGFVWLNDNEDDPAAYGWDGPQLLSGWGSIFSSTDSTEKSAIPDMIRLQSGRLLALGTQNKTTFVQDVRRYNPDAATRSAGWSTVGTITLDSAEAQKGPALLQLPSGRVLAYFAVADQVDCYYSDDDGASWGPYSYRVLDAAVGNTDIRQIRAEYSSGEVLLLVQWNTGGGAESCAQYASDDLGGRFTQIVSDWATDTTENPEAIDIVPLDGEFLVVYHDGDASVAKYYSRRIASAFTNITNATRNEIASGAGVVFVPGCTAWRDDSGIVYSYCHTTGTSRDLTPRRSDDGGDTWSDFAETAFFSGLEGEGYLHSYVAREVAGRVVVLTRWEADGSSEDPQSLAAVYVGGYGKHTAPAGAGTTGFFDTDYVAYAKDFGSNTAGGAYLPVSLPDQVNWTATGTGTSVLASSLLKFDTNGDTRYFSRAGSSNETERVFFELALNIDSGDGSLTAQEISAQLRLADASSFEYEAAINFSSAGFAVYDLAASAQVGSNVTVSIIKTTHVRVAMEQGYIRTWYASEDHFSGWEEGPHGSLTDAGATANASAVVWGHIASPAAQTISRWSMVGYCFWPKEWGPASSSFASDWFTPEDLHSKSYSVSPQQLRDKTSFAAVAGPTRLDESWFIETDYDHPVRHIFPANNASPRATWRSTDTTEHVIAWDISGLSFAHMEHTTIGIALLGINFRTAYLEVRQGATWVEVAEIDAADGFTSLRFDREGEIVFPATTGAAHKARRYLHYGDFEGGTFVDSTNSKYRKIAASTEGAWTDETAKHPRLVLEDVDDTEATTGDCQLWHKDTAALAHSFDSTGRYYRLRIPAQTTADGYFEIGQCLIGPVATFGTQYGRGRQIVGRNTTEEIGLPNGELRARKRGPQVREVEFAWVDGLDASNVNIDDPVPDYVNGAATTDPLASQRDAISLMEGVIRRQGGAAKPVVYFARFEANATTEKLNEPRQIVYGRVTSSATRTNILGDEERTNVDRLNTITIRELV